MSQWVRIVVSVASVVAVTLGPVVGLDNGLGLTPPLGYNAVSLLRR